MAYTVTPTPATNSYVKTTFKQRDYLLESVVKGNLLYNSAGEYQLAMRAYESMSQAGIVSGSISQQLVLSAQNTTATSLGGFPKVGDALLLVFTREHPVTEMAGTILTAEFVILAPHPDIYDTGTLGPVIVGGETFGTAATRPEALGALTAWLEDALVVTILKTRYPGGWTFQAAQSRLIGLPKNYDGA